MDQVYVILGKKIHDKTWQKSVVLPRSRCGGPNENLILTNIPNESFTIEALQSPVSLQGHIFLYLPKCETRDSEEDDAKKAPEKMDVEGVFRPCRVYQYMR